MSTPFRPMNDEADDRAEMVFFQALKRAPEEREAFLNDQCSIDTKLRAEVDGLLKDHEKAGAFLRVDATVSAELETEFLRLKPEEHGERIGAYKLLQHIGEGGFGVVWMAEQEQPVRRRVALKIIKLGMDTKDVVARFEQERQALAMMDHPNIAKVLDAGATPLGRPFFVMELVRGIKITEYCDQANLPTAERLRLFIAVCHAVQHAHQKGIIHRDLKPSNVLVTLHDGVPVPKVIDFGVAKATQQQRLTDLTVFTRFEQMIGTPLYMSPEQAEMSGLDIDTRSDIYSLGVLLYELLTGRTPFDPKELMRQGLDEIRRVIREEEPQMPSTFVSTLALAVRTTVAEHRQSDSTKLVGQIRGDLDWIVMKAIDKDRTRRYETATGFAQDIQRHLLSEPVQARPATQLYRFRRMVRRNKLAFTATAAVIAALIGGLGASTWMFFKEKDARQRAVAAEQEQARLRSLAETQEQKATTEASKSKQVAQFLKDMLHGVGPSVALGRDTRLLREILDTTVARVDKDLSEQRDVQSELLAMMADVYDDLGEYVKAETMDREALSIRRTLFGNQHPAVAASLDHLALMLALQGKLDEAEPMQREALAMRRTLFGADDPSVADSLSNMALGLIQRGKPSEAESMLREEMAMRKKLSGGGNLAVAEAQGNLAAALAEQGRLAEAESIYLEVLAMRRKLLPNQHPAVATTLNNLAFVLADQGKLAEAESMYLEVRAMQRKLLGDDHPLVAVTLGNLAVVITKRKGLAAAEPVWREALEIARKTATDDPPTFDRAVSQLAEALYRQNKFSEAEPLYRELKVIRQAREDAGVKSGGVAGAIASLGRLLADWAWAERSLQYETQNPNPEVTARAHEAERLLRESLAMRLGGPDAAHWRTDDIRSRLGGALLVAAVTDPARAPETQLAKFAEAEALLLASSEALQQSSLAESKYKRDALIRLTRLYEAWDKPAKSAEWKQELAEFHETKPKSVEEGKPGSSEP